MASSRLLWASRAASYLKILVFHRGFSTVLKDLKYTDSHEWVKIDGAAATIGITDRVQDHLGDVEYVELLKVGSVVVQGGSFGEVEGTKANSNIISPISGKVIGLNAELNNSPSLINSSPCKEGWLIKVEVSDANEVKNLMGADDYAKVLQRRCKELNHWPYRTEVVIEDA